MSKGFKVEVHFDEHVAKAAVQAGGKKGIWAALDVLARHSKEQVPLDQGTLKNSCAVDVNDDLQGTVSYDTPYAVRWHETNANFQRGRKMKYLEDPLNTPSVQEEMSKALQANLESSF